jgi:hypothetical protein
MISLPKLRRFLFYFFLLVYIVLCPLIILHVLGYNLQLSGKRLIQATGDLYIASFPPGARLFVDSKEYSKLTPTSVLDLPPGPHELALSLQDYIPWIHTVTIEEGKTSVLRDILLLPQQWQLEELHPAAFQDILNMSEYPNLLLQQGPRLIDLFLYELERQEILPLVDVKSPFAEARIASLIPLANGSVLLVEAQRESSGLRLLVTIKSGSVTIKDLSTLIPAGIDGLQWAAENATDLFYYREGFVARINVPSGRSYPRFPYRLRGFGIHNDTLYFLTLEGSLISLDFDAKNVRSLDEYKSINSLLPASGFIRITPNDNGVLIFRGQNGELITAGKGGTVALERIKGYRDDPDPSQLVLWQDQRLAVLRLDPAAVSGQITAAAPQLQWIPVSGINVQQAFFVLEASHILYRDGESVVLLGPEREGQWRKFPVANVHRDTSIYYSDHTGRLYYIDGRTGRLSSLQIFEKTQFVDQLLLDLRKKLPP